MSRSSVPTHGGVDLWRPLRTPIFRQLLIADVLSDVGTFMQGVGSAWLMVSLGAGPLYVALTQTASTLPFFLFALPAGSIGDIVNRRRLILYTETWMVCIAAVLATATLAGIVTPWLLLTLTFALSAGDAIETPTWRAVLPELVRKEDLPAASALNGIEFNMARAVGPALAGGLIAVGGAVVMQAARARWSTEAVVSVAVAALGTMTAAMAWVHSLPGLMLIMLVGGSAWITFISLANALVQTLA